MFVSAFLLKESKISLVYIELWKHVKAASGLLEGGPQNQNPKPTFAAKLSGSRNS